MNHLLVALIAACLLSSCKSNVEEPLVCSLSDGSPYSYYSVRFPTAFTPNGDGLNDRFHVIKTGPTSVYSIRIFNKDGSVLFTSTDTDTVGWDGRNSSGDTMPPGRYRAEISLPDGQGGTYTQNHCIALLSYGGHTCIPRSVDGDYYFEDMFSNGTTAESICP